MAVFKCKMCGGTLDITGGMTVCECEYCGSTQTVPQLDDEKKINLFTRANRLRLACEFDKAFGVYESIVSEFSEEAEAYWGLILCKYGIEYVDDPATGKKIPTCHRSSFDSVMDDPNFEMVMEYSDAVSRRVYREEAKQIEELRKGIIEVSAKEEPYDIFICYKETDENGSRTIDSVIAQDVYDALTEKGYKVFFSRITLEDKLGQEYEPYIFAALNSAKVMLAFGTDYEYYNAVWVKNEWSRFLALIAKGEKKTLIPCYKNIDAYDMPKEFARLQAQDMGKVGAIQDLLRGIGKIIPISTRTENDQSKNPEYYLLERGNMALEDENWEKASSFFNSVIDTNPKSAEAYLGIALGEFHFKNWNQLEEEYYYSQNKLQNNLSFQKAITLASGELKKRFHSLDSDLKDKIDKTLKEWKTEKQELINEANKQIDSGGIILAQESGSLASFVDKKSAYKLNEGYISSLFSTDTKSRRAVAEKPYILLYDGVLENILSILPILEQIVQAKASVVIFSNVSESSELLSSLILNHLRNTFQSIAVNISTVIKEVDFDREIFCNGINQPDANMDSEILYDIAAFTGGVVFSEKSSSALNDATLDMLGRASEVIADRKATIIINGHGTQDAIATRKKAIEREKNSDISGRCQEYYEKRLEMFDYGAAVINVGGDDKTVVNYRLTNLKESLSYYSQPLSDEKDASNDWETTSKNLMSLAEYNSDCCGAIVCQQSKTSTSGVRVTQTGAIVGTGFISPYMITDKKRLEVLFDNPLILITSSTISCIESILPALEEIVRVDRKLLIIAEEVNSDALKTINVILEKGNFKVACINAPKYNNEVDTEFLEDLALQTGAYYFSKQNSHEIKDAKLSDFGSARHVWISKTATVIVDGGCTDYHQIQARGQKLLDDIKNTSDPKAKEHNKRRYRQLMAHSVVVYTGDATDSVAQNKLENMSSVIKKRNERIAADTSSLEGMRLSDEQLQWVKEYYSSLDRKNECFQETMSLYAQCKARVEFQLAEEKRKKEEQEALEKQRIEEEKRLIERQKEEARQRELAEKEAARVLAEKEAAYAVACALQDTREEDSLEKAAEAFSALSDFKDSLAHAEECTRTYKEMKADRERCEREEAERKLAEESARKKRERAEKMANLNAKKSALQNELSNLKGIFSGKRRREIEGRIAEIDYTLRTMK